ncbi:phosphoribosylanthranilate isomerase [Natrarchaeobaculum sulfurireducens]|uniref:N-(5'-phosphoribosyl)anthranilate isomerase n=1 Tax=Natrarchaeobaculum sulfurireducens TaxID=2044521 RepID=A0A346PR46_9EURY|nr:phosphoribosylanthranilate isomerase [Natrarchaeobaculum sulfurireducens]AXR81991.1 Phosphoribosylanthranilate isomerase [Natrarchaeobaculum sulfurireducens]
MTRVKICGVTTRGDLETVADAGADAVGIICDVTVDTPREVSLERARDLIEAAPPFVTTVLVTMATDPERTIELVETATPDAIQLHGEVDRDAIDSLRAATGVTILLAADAEDLADADRYDDLVDGLVVDSTDEDGAGGTGETHDWERTRTAATHLESPVILAGGLEPDNVADAIRAAEPFAVDVSSGVEAEEGRKDPDAVHSFVARAGRATTVEPEVSPSP